MAFSRRPYGGPVYAKGVPVKISHKTPSQGKSTGSSRPKHIGLYSPGGGHSSPPTTKHHQGGASTIPQNVLLAHIFLSQEGRLSQTDHRFVRSEQTPGYSKVQNGTCPYHQAGLMHSPVGMHSGYRKSVSQRSNMVQTPEIPGFLYREIQQTQSVCMAVSPVRPVPGPLGLPQDRQTNKSPSKGLNVSSCVLSGRFRIFCNIESRTVRSLPGIQTNPEEAQPVNQLGEVGFHPQAITNLPGSEIRPQKPFSLAPGGEDSFGSVSMRQVNRSPDMLQKKFRIPSRASKFRSNLCPFRTSPSSASDKVVESPHFSSPEGSPHSFRQCGEILNSGLDVQVLPVDARSHAPSTPNRGTHDGCIQGGVVWGSPTSEGTKAMAGLSLFNPYQLVGAKGSPFVTSALPTYDPRPDGFAVDRQYHSPCLSPKPRFQDHSSHALDRGHLRTMRFPKHQISAAPSPGCPQRPGGCRLQVSSNLHGVDARQIHLQTDCSSSSHFSPSGPLRHSGQPPAGELCVSLPRPKRGGQRCTPLELEQVAIHLPVSSPSSSSGMLLQTRRVQRRGSARDRCTSLRGRSLGTQTEMQVQHSPHSSSSQPSHGQRRNVRFPPQFSASRLDTVNKVFKDQGFAANTLRIFDQRHAPSTSKSYQFVWGLLYKYLEERGINAENFQKKYVWHFLTYHHEVLLKKYRTLAKYRAALVEPLKFAVGYDLNTCGFSPGYMRGLFRIRPPVVSAPMPTWTLNIICSYLKSTIFEPLREKDLYLVKIKLVLLLFIATGRRASEIANLGKTSFQFSNYPGTFLNWAHRKFLNKNFIVVREFKTRTGCRFPDQPYLQEIEGEDKSLCPKRAYDQYLDRTRGQFGKFLWDHSPRNEPDTSKITRLVVSSISSALRRAGLPIPNRIGPHQFRKLAASYGRLLCSRHKDETFLMNVLGFSSVNVMRKVYIKRVPHLAHACVVPGGTYIPGTSPRYPRDLK